jgi:glycosyltransferase involved in cell wall biosynthesis
MKIAIIHYHLHPGGVTRIIDSQVKSLRASHPDLNLEVICGFTDKPSVYSELNMPVIILPDLFYMQKDNYTTEEIIKIVNELFSYFTTHLNKKDILHFHNLNLGKNPAATYCIYKLAQEGYRVFNHTHDFPEDRPENMKFLHHIFEEKLGEDMQEILYPKDLSNYGFGVINSMDQARLSGKGIPDDRIAYLPNPVSIPEKLVQSKTECRKTIVNNLKLDPEKFIITYPVRVIRRKNIGELILLSEIFRDQAVFLVTLAPQNPVEIQFYNQWIEFCKKHQFDNIIFEVNYQIDFNILVKGSDFCITTSIREGFGMTYMEPWLYDTPVTGRDIPEITRDFKRANLIFPNLYDQIFIRSKNCDFKDLSMPEQMETIKSVSESEETKRQILDDNKPVQNLLYPVDRVIIEQNKKQIIQTFSFKNYGKKILECYRKFFGHN